MPDYPMLRMKISPSTRPLTHRPENAPTRFSKTVILGCMFTSFSILVSCDGGTSSDQQHQGTVRAQVDSPWTAPRLKANGLLEDVSDTNAVNWFYSDQSQALAPLLTPDPPVTAKIYKSVRDSFNLMFSTLKSGVQEPLDSIAVEILWSDIDSICRKELVPAHNQVRGLVFHYGYDPAHRWFKLGISAVLMTYDSGAGEYDYDTTATTFYEVDGHMRLQKGSRALWLAKEGKDYFDEVHHQRQGEGSWETVDVAQGDVGSYAMAYEAEIEDLGAHNSARIDPDTKLVVTCIAESSKDARDTCHVRHHLMVHLRNGAINLMDDLTGQIGRFKMRGADLGTPCPPRCKKFKYGDNSRLCSTP